ncbi:DUF2510 domain-containing protein [Mycobacterium sp. Dal123C01]|uniref:DUF2510 domain-containing protein n=1 Tax=Mycobacterium sp. Dal123C01 TaxID=3457577 RepID=UPI00403EE1FD
MTDPYRRFSVRLYQHTGAVILWHQRTFTFTGTLKQCERAYRDAQLHCLLAGWWSVVSLLVMNWIALFSNYSAIRKVRALAAQAPAPYAGNPYAPTGQSSPVGPPPPVVPPAPVVAPRPLGPPPGWYPNPSGPGQRYWDGVTWTHWTHPR